MRGLDLVLLLLAASVALRLVAARFAIPYTTVLVVCGLGIALVPRLPRVEFPPEVLFLIFVPPLLYSDATSFPLRDLRREMGAIARLAIVLMFVSIFAVAFVARALHPSFTWAAAITLGAIVAPPDPIVVMSAMRSLRLNRSVEAILNGEGLPNDVAALLTYRTAVAAAVVGTFSIAQVGAQLVVSAPVSVAIGLAVGWLSTQAHRRTRSIPAVASAVSLLTPFASFISADHLGASGVLAVVTTGVYVARAVPRVVGPETRVQILVTWNVVSFILESLLFILVGLELPLVAHALDRFPIGLLLGEAAAVILCLVLVRIAWVVPSAFIFRGLGRRLHRREVQAPDWRAVVFVAWSGLRGGDSLVLALAVPLATMSGHPFPARDQIVFITFCVIFSSLVLQAPTIAPLARRLRLCRGREDEQEEAHARLAVAEAGLSALDDPRLRDSSHPEVTRYVKRRHRERARRWAAREKQIGAPGDATNEHFVVALSHAQGALDESRVEEYRRIRTVMVETELRALLDCATAVSSATRSCARCSAISI